MTDNEWVLKYFTYDHLPEGPLRECSRRFAEEANLGVIPPLDEYGLPDYDSLNLRENAMNKWCLKNLSNNPEREAALDKINCAFSYEELRYLLEAKDCAVRSLLPVSNMPLT